MPWEGHFRPLVPLAHALTARGHDVAFAAAAAWEPRARDEGFALLAAGLSQAEGRERVAPLWDAVLELPAERRRPLAFATIFARTHAPEKLPHLLEIAPAWGADAIVYDSCDLAAPIAAAALGLPAVNHSFGTMIPLAALEASREHVDPLWRRHGLEPDPYAGAFRGLYVELAPPSFAWEQPRGKVVRMRPVPDTGAGPAPPWLDELEQPLVYVTMGTVHNQPELFRPLLDGLDGHGSALVTVGRNVEPDDLGPLPPRVRVERFVPQAHVLPRCAAVVSHGGSGTTLGCARTWAAARARAAGRRSVRQCRPRRGRRRSRRAPAGRGHRRVCARGARARARGAGVRRGGTRNRGGDRGDGHRRRGGNRGRGARSRRLVWPACPRAPARSSSLPRLPPSPPWSSPAQPSSRPKRWRPSLPRPRSRCRARARRRSSSRSESATTPRRSDLRRAAQLYEAGKRDEAGRIFGRYDSLEAKLGSAFAAWPATEERVEQLGALYPRSALVQLHVGLARYWAGLGGAVTAWREARDVEPDTPYAVYASDYLHARDFAPGLPAFTPSFPYRVDGETLGEQLETLEADRTVRGRLLYGVALQRLGRPVSARRAFADALRLAPNDVDARVADAVGRYEKNDPSAAFSRLGPLTRRFPEAASIRFHLGVLLLWQGDVEEAKRQLRLASEAEPGGRIAREARRYLKEVEKAGTG